MHAVRPGQTVDIVAAAFLDRDAAARGGGGDGLGGLGGGDQAAAAALRIGQRGGHGMGAGQPIAIAARAGRSAASRRVRRVLLRTALLAVLTLGRAGFLRPVHDRVIRRPRGCGSGPSISGREWHLRVRIPQLAR